MAAWDEAAGRLARRSRPQLLRADVLVVDADDAATAEALRWSAERILGALESSGGRRIARTLEVRVRPAGGPGSPTGGW